MTTKPQGIKHENTNKMEEKECTNKTVKELDNCLREQVENCEGCHYYKNVDKE